MYIEVVYFSSQTYNCKAIAPEVHVHLYIMQHLPDQYSEGLYIKRLQTPRSNSVKSEDERQDKYIQ